MKALKSDLYSKSNEYISPDDMTYSQIYATLNDEQKNALDCILKGENVFITGNAGAGKSYLIKALSKYCDDNDISLVKTAVTGVASNEIDGVTIHSQFRLKIGLDFEKPKAPLPFMRDIDILLIDEISMLRLDVFDKLMGYITLENSGRIPRLKRPVQLVLIGDFYQLPPVITKQDKPFLKDYYGEDIQDGFCFQSRNWRLLDIKTLNLTAIMRQEDKDFCDALNRCKQGDTSCINYFKSHTAKQEIEGAIWVCGKNSTVDFHNSEGLSKINSEPITVYASYEGDVSAADKLCENAITFKIGSRVVMLANDTEFGEYQNGSLGTILKVVKDKIFVKMDNGHISEISPKSFPKYEYNYAEDTIKDADSSLDGAEKVNQIWRGQKKLKRSILGEAKQYPFRLGYAVTIHKSQGQTYDRMNLEPEIFSNGQLYTALSRCKSVDKIFLKGAISERMIMTSKEVIRFFKAPDNYTFFKDEMAKIPERMTTLTFPHKYLKQVQDVLKYLEENEVV